MNRRQFCRTLAALGAGALAAPLASACAPIEEATGEAAPTGAPTRGPTLTARPAATATPAASATAAPSLAAATPTMEANPMSQVALIKTTDRAEGVRRGIELLGLNPVRGERVLLKPNFNSADVSPGSTHPDVLRALVEQLNDLGAHAITVADRSGMGVTQAVMRQVGARALADELGFDLIAFDDLGEDDWAVRQSGDFHWPQGFAVPKLLLDAACVVQTCNLKTHRYGGHFTLSLKNSVGLAAKRVDGSGYDYMSELHSSPYQRAMIAEINTAYSPALIVMDGVEAFVDGGPDRGKKVSAEAVLVGTDRVAMDAVGVALLRLFGTTPEVSRGKVFEQEQIARAVELGLGVGSPEAIEIVAEDAEGQAYAAQIAQMLTA